MAKRLFLALAALLIAGACSGSNSSEASSSPTTPDDASSCQASANQIVDRFDEFLVPYSDLDPGEFLAADLEGLDEFQNDIAQTVVDVATNPNDNCTERDLEAQVEQALDEYAGTGTLNQYLVGLVRQGVQVETRDVVVGPDDDLVSILATLGPGSSVTFTEGTFALDVSILVQGDLVFVGAGRDATVIESSADTAAMAVLGGGSVVMNDFTVRHVGEVPASVVVAVDSSLELVNMAVAGGVVDTEGGGGSGVVLTETDQASDQPSVVIDQSIISDNAAAGVAITGSFAPQILNTTIESNDQCGICFFDSSAGQVQSSTLHANGVGIQSSGESAPELSLNEFVDNEVAGLLIEDQSTATVIENSFAGVETVAIDVQGTSNSILQRNMIGPHAVGISLREDSQASASNNTITGADVAILIGGSAAPVVFENNIDQSLIAGILHTESSTGEFTTNQITPEAGAGVVVEGSAAPEHTEVQVQGGLVGVVFRETASGIMLRATLTGQQVGIETNDHTSPTIEMSTVVGALDAATILGGETTAIFRQNTIDAPISIGIQTSGQASPLVEENTVSGGDTAVLITESSTPDINNNTLVDLNFGIGVSGEANPIIRDNEITNAVAGAMSFEGESSGQVRGNSIVDAGVVGIRVAGSASPELEANVLFAAVTAPASIDADEPAAEDATDDTNDDESPAASESDEQEEPSEEQSGAGLLYAEQGSGTAVDNELFGFVIGIQVSDSAAPEITANRVDGAGIGGVGILYGGAGAGSAQDNLSINQQLGFQLSGTTAPVLIGNTVEDAAVAAFLIQGESVAELSNNACVRGNVGIVVLEDAAPVFDSNDCSVQ